MKKIITLLLIFTTTLLFSQVPNYVPTNGLVGWWPFTGNANDLSGNGNNGLVNGAILTTDRNGNQSSAYEFFGNNWIQCNNNSMFNVGTGSFTISCWSTKVGTGTFQHLVTRNEILTWPNAFSSYILRYEQNGITFFGSGNATSSNGNVSTGSISNLSNWNHIVGVYNSNITTMSVYVNGILISTSQIVSNPQNHDNNGQLFFGVEHPTISLPSGPNFLTGKLDDIGIWNRALTQQEITNLYNASLSTEDFAINGFTIYPNPTTTFLNFKTSIQVEKILIYNMLGQLVQQEKVNALEGTINIEKLAQGTYLVKVNDIDKGYTIIKN